jgi:hypothetical protein
MTPEQLAYYMRGIAETSSEPPTRLQWGAIREAVLSSTQDPAHTIFAGPMPPEVQALFSRGCQDCTPKGGVVPPPAIDDTLI